MTARKLTVRCEKGRYVGAVEALPNGSPMLTVQRLSVPSVEPAGYFDQARLAPDEGGATKGEPEVSILLDGSSPFAKATFEAACGCHQRVRIRPSQLDTAFNQGERVVKLSHSH